MSLFLLFNTKENILKNVGGNQTVDATVDIFFVMLWKSAATINWLNNILQTILLYAQQKNITHTGLVLE